MSYQVLARKWRPRTFSEMVGQEHVVRALSNALNQQRLHHAYLFTGTRGVGKTTLARILAKSLNCEERISATPCGVCSACRQIDEGRFADLLEVDAASRTKVDETRELLENVPYAPVSGRYKIYLIDEVHMFSNHSFNALLKTLEEPPSHVKFLLATTDPQKLPVTILSRCLQFNLKRLPLPQISGQLAYILGQEQAEYEQSALDLLARAADGSMRDALSLLDQALAFGSGRVFADDVRAMLGDIAGDHVMRLVSALADQNGAELLTAVAELAERAADFSQVLTDVLTLLHRIAIAQAFPDENAFIDQNDPDQVRGLAKRFTAEDLQLYYQIGLLGQRDLPLAPDPRGGFEMVMLRMLAFRPRELAPTATAANTNPEPVGANPAPVSEPGLASQVTGSGVDAQAQTDEVRSAEAASEGVISSDWGSLVNSLGLGGVARQLADNCALHSHDGDRLRLRLDPACKHLQVASSEERLRKALQCKLGAQTSVVIEVAAAEVETPAQRMAREQAERQRRAEKAMAEDPLVQAMEETFSARIIPETVRPVGKSDS